MSTETQEAEDIAPASSVDRNRKDAVYALLKKRFKVAFGCITIRTQSELIIRRVQFIRRTNEAPTQATCTGNAKGYHSEHGN